MAAAAVAAAKGGAVCKVQSHSQQPSLAQEAAADVWALRHALSCTTHVAKAGISRLPSTHHDVLDLVHLQSWERRGQQQRWV